MKFQAILTNIYSLILSIFSSGRNFQKFHIVFIDYTGFEPTTEAKIASALSLALTN